MIFAEELCEKGAILFYNHHVNRAVYGETKKKQYFTVQKGYTIIGYGLLVRNCYI